MFTRLIYPFLCLPFLLCCQSALALQTIPLSEYLDHANHSGLRIIYSSDLVPFRFKVTYDETRPINLVKLKRALDAYGLELSEVKSKVYVVKQSVQANKQMPIPEHLSQVRMPELEEVVVSSSRYRLFASRTATDSMLTSAELQQRPVVGNDVGRVVNQLPGSASDGISARPRVRGGNEDETLITIDGMRLYQPFHFNHFNNLFSSFDSRVIASVDFYSGGFPAQLGDRLSAAMVIETKSPEALKPIKELGFGLFNMSYFQAAGDDDQSWVVSLRRSNLELLGTTVEADLGEPSFGDVYARYTRRLKNGDSLSVNALLFGDDIDINNASGREFSESNYANTYLWLNLEQDISAALFVTSKLGYIQVKNNREGQVDKPGEIVGDLKDNRGFNVINLKQDYEWHSTIGLLTFGWDYRFLQADYEFASNISIDPRFAALSNVQRPAVSTINLDESGHQAAIYINLKRFITDSLIMELGSRVDAQHYEHATQTNVADVRLGLLYEFSDMTSVRLGWGRYSQSQGIHELNINDQESSFQSGQRAEHTILSLSHRFSDRFGMRVEAYKKHAGKVRDYYQNLANPLTIVPELQPDRFKVTPQAYNAGGIELSFDAEFEVTKAWINYSYSHVEDELPGRDIKRSWDQAHSVNLGVSTEVGKWLVSGLAAYHKGWLTTPLYEKNGAIITGVRNSERFNHYLSVDMKLIRHWQLKNSELRLEAGLTNLLDRKNQVGIDYSLDANGTLDLDPKYGLPMAPFLDLFWSF